MHTYNLSAAAQAYFVNETGIDALMEGAVIKIYSGRQPVTADTGLLTENTVLATIPMGTAILGVYGKKQIDTLDAMPDVTWSASGTAVWARVKDATGNTTIFDCSVDLASQDPDLVIKQNPVRAGDVCHIENGNNANYGHRRKISLTP